MRKIDGITYEEVYLDEEDGRYHYHCYTCSASFSGPDEYRIMNKADEHERSHQETSQ